MSVFQELSCPLKQVPECWADDKRMNALYSPFRRREVNPADWESKMKFWVQSVGARCVDVGSAVVSVQGLQKEFVRKGKAPLCLVTVIEEMLRLGIVQSKEDFFRWVSHDTWTGWAVHSFLKSPAQWGLSKLKGMVVKEDVSVVEYIHTQYVKELGEQLMNIVKADHCLRKVITLDDVKGLLRLGDEATLYATLRVLELNNKVKVMSTGGVNLVKFNLSKNRCSDVSEADLALFRLDQTHSILRKTLEKLEEDKTQCIALAKVNLERGLRHVAKSYLRKKKMLEKQLESKALALENVDTLTTRLQAIESDAKVLEAYMAGASALKKSLESAGLTEDKVTNTLIQVQEAQDIQDDIQSILSQPLDSTTDLELESELTELLSASEHEDADISLPDAPSHPLELEKEKDLCSGLTKLALT